MTASEDYCPVAALTKGMKDGIAVAGGQSDEIRVYLRTRWKRRVNVRLRSGGRFTGGCRSRSMGRGVSFWEFIGARL
jgi:hypothetical protein